jgi:cytidyltransferase-like protein
VERSLRRKFRRAILGGTFDQLHAGHERLLGAAFRLADEVGIGLTTSRYLRKHPKQFDSKILPYALRRRNLDRYVRRTFPSRRFWIAPLNDVWGRSVEPGAGILVVSRETLAGARSVNDERRRRGLPPLEVLAVPVVRAYDHKPLHSTRIRAGEIDVRGHLLRGTKRPAAR